MTKGKHFKRRVREAKRQTGESYAAARARLEKRNDDPPSPFARMRALTPLIRLASDEVHAELRKGDVGGLKWLPYQQRPGCDPLLLPPGARALRDQLESLGDGDLFAYLVIFIWGKAPFLSLSEVIRDARQCVDEHGIDFGSDYTFQKLPASGHYFAEGLALAEHAKATPEVCWHAGFGTQLGELPDRASLPRRIVDRPWWPSARS